MCEVGCHNVVVYWFTAGFRVFVEITCTLCSEWRRVNIITSVIFFNIPCKWTLNRINLSRLLAQICLIIGNNRAKVSLSLVSDWVGQPHRRWQPYSRGSKCCPIICTGPALNVKCCPISGIGLGGNIRLNLAVMLTKHAEERWARELPACTAFHWYRWLIAWPDIRNLPPATGLGRLAFPHPCLCLLYVRPPWTLVLAPILDASARDYMPG